MQELHSIFVVAGHRIFAFCTKGNCVKRIAHNARKPPNALDWSVTNYSIKTGYGARDLRQASCLPKNRCR